MKLGLKTWENTSFIFSANQFEEMALLESNFY